MADVVYFVEDLLFTSKIRETARQLGRTAERAKDEASLKEAARQAQLVVIDLRHPRAFAALDLLASDPVTAAVPSVGFIDHEQVDRMDEARQKGCRTVLAKGKFSSELPRLLEPLKPA